jgi:hypothetical protein
MKSTLIAMALAASTLAACQSSQHAPLDPSPGSKLVADFSILATAERLATPELKKGVTSGGSAQSVSRSSTRYERWTELNYRLRDQDGAPFDERAFLARLTAEAAAAATSDGLRVAASEISGAHDSPRYHFRLHALKGSVSSSSRGFTYAGEDRSGSFEVTGTRLDGNQFVVRGRMVEEISSASRQIASR